LYSDLKQATFLSTRTSDCRVWTGLKTVFVSSRCSLTISVRVQQSHTAQKLTILIQNYYKVLQNLLHGRCDVMSNGSIFLLFPYADNGTKLKMERATKFYSKVFNFAII
jgi:hypothetical protein